MKITSRQLFLLILTILISILFLIGAFYLNLSQKEVQNEEPNLDGNNNNVQNSLDTSEIPAREGIYSAKNFSFRYNSDFTLGNNSTDSDALILGTNSYPDIQNGVPYLSIGEGGAYYPALQTFFSEKELVKSRIIYNASSTSQHINPDKVRVTEKPTDDGSYYFEINDPDIGVIQIVRAYPITRDKYPLSSDKAADARFLWIEYRQDVESLFTPILESLEVKRP